MGRYVVQQGAAPAGSVVAQIIAGLDDEQLASLLAARPDLAQPPPRSLGELERRAGSWHSVLACFHTMDLAGQQVVQALSLLPAPTRVEELAGLLGPGVTPAQLEPVLDRLASLALVARDPGLRLVEVCYETTSPAGLGPPLAELVTGVRVDALQSIARHLGAARHSRKADVEAAVRAELTRPGRVQAVLDGAPAQVVELAFILAAGPPTVTVPYYVARSDDSPVGWLRARGLVVSVGWESATMPREVAIALRGGHVFPDLQLACPPLALRPVDPDAVEAAALERARQLVRDVVRLLEELEQRPATLLKSGGVGIREVRRAATLLGVGESDAARVIELAAAAGLLGRDYAGGRLLPASGYDAWRSGDTTSRWTAVAAAWLDLSHQLSVAGSPDVNDKPIPPMLDHAPDPQAARVRRLLLASLADAPVGSAASEVSLIDRLGWAAPSAWVEGPGPDDLVGELVMLGLAADGALTSLGRALAEGGLQQARDALTQLLPPPTREFVLQADLTAIATGELACEVRLELELMADLESSGAASVYRFSPDSLRRAFDSGRDVASLLAFLDEHAKRGVPQPLAYLVGDLGRRFGQLRLRSVGCYVRSEDTALLTELTRVRTLARLGLSLIAPTVLTASADDTTVMAALRAEGYLPAAEGADGQTQVRQPGRLRAAASPPESYANGPDLAALAALAGRLRQAGPEPAGSPLTLVRDLGPDLFGSEEPSRPAARVSEPRRVRDLLAAAVEEDWVVAVSAGGPEVILMPYDVEDGWLSGEDPAIGGEIRLPVAQLTSVRVLDDDEEERALYGGQ